MTSNSLILVGDYSQKSEDGTLIRRGVGLTVAQCLQAGGKVVAWALNTGYSGPNVPKQRIQDFFSEAERRERALDGLYNADRNNLSKQHKQLLKNCHDLLTYALPKSTVATQLITFKILVAMITRYPGIRCLFHDTKSSKSVSPPLVASYFQDLWNRPEPCGEEWTFYRDFAIYCLGDSGPPTKLVENELPSKFGQLKSLEDNLNKDPVEILLSFCSADSQWDHEKLCAIRYLASILELPRFWRPQIEEGTNIEKRLLDFLSCLCETIIQLIRDTEPRSVDDSEVDLSPLWTSARGAVDSLAFATFGGFLQLHRLQEKLPTCPSQLASMVSLLKRPEMERSFPNAHNCAHQVERILNWEQPDAVKKLFHVLSNGQEHLDLLSTGDLADLILSLPPSEFVPSALFLRENAATRRDLCAVALVQIATSTGKGRPSQTGALVEACVRTTCWLFERPRTLEPVPNGLPLDLISKPDELSGLPDVLEMLIDTLTRFFAFAADFQPESQDINRTTHTSSYTYWFLVLSAKILTTKGLLSGELQKRHEYLLAMIATRLGEDDVCDYLCLTASIYASVISAMCSSHFGGNFLRAVTGHRDRFKGDLSSHRLQLRKAVKANEVVWGNIDRALGASDNNSGANDTTGERPALSLAHDGGPTLGEESGGRSMDPATQSGGVYTPVRVEEVNSSGSGNNLSEGHQGRSDVVIDIDSPTS